MQTSNSLRNSCICSSFKNAHRTNTLLFLWLLHIQTSLTLRTSKPCRQGAFMCFCMVLRAESNILTVKYNPEAQVRSKASLCEICDGQSGTERSISQRTSLFPCHYSSISSPFSTLSTCYSHLKDKRRTTGNLKKSNVVSDIVGYLVTKYFFFSI